MRKPFGALRPKTAGRFCSIASCLRHLAKACCFHINVNCFRTTFRGDYSIVPANCPSRSADNYPLMVSTCGREHEEWRSMRSCEACFAVYKLTLEGRGTLRTIRKSRNSTTARQKTAMIVAGARIMGLMLGAVGAGLAAIGAIALWKNGPVGLQSWRTTFKTLISTASAARRQRLTPASQAEVATAANAGRR